MTSEAWLTIIGAVLNGAVTWGVMTTKLSWIRRDVDELRKWKDDLTARGFTKAVS